jgi:hypothetical protein
MARINGTLHGSKLRVKIIYFKFKIEGKTMRKNLLLSMIVSTLMLAEALAADVPGIPDMDRAVFDARTNTLVLPKIQYIGADGKMTKVVYTADVVISKDKPDEPLELKVTKLEPVVTDEHGCVAPETWHEEMGHCMDQN